MHRTQTMKKVKKAGISCGIYKTGYQNGSYLLLFEKEKCYVNNSS